MSWALRFDGSNDYAVANSWVPSANTWNASLEFTVIANGGSNSVVFSNGSHTDGLYVNYDYSGAGGIYTGGNYKTWTAVVGNTYLIEWVSTSGNVETFVNGVSLGTANTTCNPAIALMNFGRRVQTSAQYAQVDVISAKFTDPVLSSNSHSFSPDNSDHSNTGDQPALVDTISGNNAKGYGFAPDGSAWHYEPGGGEVSAINKLKFGSSMVKSVKYYNGTDLVDVELNVNGTVVWKI